MPLPRLKKGLNKGQLVASDRELNLHPHAHYRSPEHISSGFRGTRGVARRKLLSSFCTVGRDRQRGGVRLKAKCPRDPAECRKRPAAALLRSALCALYNNLPSCSLYFELTSQFLLLLVLVLVILITNDRERKSASA